MYKHSGTKPLSTYCTVVVLVITYQAILLTSAVNRALKQQEAPGLHLHVAPYSITAPKC
jgi:hypothetical protein